MGNVVVTVVTYSILCVYSNVCLSSQSSKCIYFFNQILFVSFEPPSPFFTFYVTFYVQCSWYSGSSLFVFVKGNAPYCYKKHTKSFLFTYVCPDTSKKCISLLFLV